MLFRLFQVHSSNTQLFCWLIAVKTCLANDVTGGKSDCSFSAWLRGTFTSCKKHMQKCTQPYYDLLTQFRLVAHTCICIAIQTGNLCALCISIAKRGRKKLSQPSKTEIGNEWVLLESYRWKRERKKEKRSRTRPVLCWWDISKYSGNEPCRGNPVQHSQSSRDS